MWILQTSHSSHTLGWKPRLSGVQLRKVKMRYSTLHALPWCMIDCSLHECFSSVHDTRFVYFSLDLYSSKGGSTLSHFHQWYLSYLSRERRVLKARSRLSLRSWVQDLFSDGLNSGSPSFWWLCFFAVDSFSLTSSKSIRNCYLLKLFRNFILTPTHFPLLFDPIVIWWFWNAGAGPRFDLFVQCWTIFHFHFRKPHHTHSHHLPLF